MMMRSGQREAPEECINLKVDICVLNPPPPPPPSVDMMVKMHRKRLRQEDSDKVVSGDTYSKRLRKQ